MKLNEIYSNINSDVIINGISINSKECKKGDIFVCVTGVTTDRHDFIDDAINNGAAAVVVTKDVGKKSIPVIKVDDADKELFYLSQKLYNYPDKKLKLIGVTGTDGKTSVATITQTLIGKEKCGYMGTNGYSYGNFKGDTPNTTPSPHLIYSYFDTFVKNNCVAVSFEASSEAFYRKRLIGMEFDVAIYTNVTSEHLNTHKTIENYLDCKLNLFRQTKKDGICVINKDDKYFDKVKEASNGKVVTYGLDKDNTLVIDSYKLFTDHTEINFIYRGESLFINSPLLGEFNIYNLAASLLACLEMGVDIDTLMKNIPLIKVDGRLTMIDTNSDYYVMVDYAHTPNGIYQMLKFVKMLKMNNIIVVIGQAGERDKFKRPEVGKVVLENASYAIFTYEDPRSEDPREICEDIVREAKLTHNNYEIVIDRREAIEKAVNMASTNDIVLILGKGNETYEKLKNEVIYFNDVEEAKKAIEKRNNSMI